MFFTLCNESISEITAKVGPLCIFYFAPGCNITSAVYFLIKGAVNVKNGNGFWIDHNIKFNGKVSRQHAWGYFLYSLIYFLIQNMAFLTMYFSALAKVNVGLITTIWSVNPLFIAIMDFIIFKQQLRYFHLLGMVAIVVCTVLLSISGVIMPKTPINGGDAIEEPIEKVMPTWVPVIFGVVTPMCFTANGMLVKHLTGPKMGFDASILSFSSYLVVNLIIVIVAIVYWVKVEFDTYLFIVGMIGSIINTLGITSIQNALSCGPAGPVSALAACSNLLLVVIEAVKNKEMLSPLEVVAFIFGTFGSLELVIPDVFEKLCGCLCCKGICCCVRYSKKQEVDSDGEQMNLLTKK